MDKYKILDKDLKGIRHKWEYDLYEENLESQKRIDKFYSEEDISENDMICRKYKLEVYLNRINILFYPIIITVIFGLLVNLVFNKISSIPNFIEMFQKLQSIPTTSENMLELIKLYALLIFLFVLVVLVFVLVFFIPFPPLYFAIEIGENKIHQRKYELEILEDKLNKKIEENKSGKEYSSGIRKKPKIKFIFLFIFIFIIIISIGFGKYLGLAYDKILLLDLFGIICGYCITKIVE